MSELQTRFIDDTYVEYYNTGKHDLAQIYLKSEADKVIAEKDEKIDELKEHIDELQKATDSAWSKVNGMYDELRYQKFKRCLAMAEWCHNESLWWYSKGYGFEKYDEFWEKWENRWLELAEEFKEGV